MIEDRKIGIVTVYNSYNYGSLLQAQDLEEILRNYGTVYFVNTEARNSFKDGIKEIMKGIRTGNRDRVVFELRRFKYFRRNEKKLQVISLNHAMETCDIFVFGSDEIWNVSRKKFSEFPIFWGEGITGVKKIAYAPSINNSSLSDFESGQWKRLISDFTAISVRDSYSKTVIQKLTKQEIQIVLDPTMLPQKKAQFHRAIENNYIALYVSDNKFVDKNKATHLIKDVAAYLKEKTVSLGLWSRWADVNFSDQEYPPFYYYTGADYVITNTFHGTVFAILFKKQFVTFAGKNQKIKELLISLGLKEREVSENMTNDELVDLLKRKIDFQAVDMTIEKLRQASMDFLRDNVL